jgi:phosphoadenosine phosphosulfate reductase
VYRGGYEDMNRDKQTYINISEYDIDALTDNACTVLRDFEPEQGYYGCFSGGKDSIVIKHVAKLSGVNVTWHYNNTTIDPPELIYYIREHHPDVIWENPKKNFFTRMVEKGFPTRICRWCCEEYKESMSPIGARLILGVRATESPRRAKVWKMVTAHRKTGDFAISPILNWLDRDVWDFIRIHKLPYCSLYDDGFKRLGCIGCPMGREASRIKEFNRWPQYEKKWKRSFQRIWDRRTGSKQRDGCIWFGDAYFKNWEEMWGWWLSDKPLPKKLISDEPELFNEADNIDTGICLGIVGMFSE